MAIERIPISGPDGRINREAWLALRTQDITASDVPAVCGQGLYGSPAKVWAEKRGLLPPQEMTAAMERGLWGEAAVFEAIGWRFPDWEVRRAKIYMRDGAARIGATPDGAAIIPSRDGVVVVQAKVIAEPVFRADWLINSDDDIAFGEAEPPLAYQLQTLTEAMLADACAGVLAVLVVGAFRWSLRTFWVERHADAETMIRERVTAFWRDYLDPGVQPPIDPARDDALVRRLFPQDDGTEIDLSTDNAMPILLDEREVIKARLKADKDRCEAIETDIKGKLGTHTYGRLADGRLVSWKLQQRKAYTVSETSFRVLRVVKGR